MSAPFIPNDSIDKKTNISVDNGFALNNRQVII